MELIFGPIAGQGVSRLHSCSPKLKVLALIGFVTLVSSLQTVIFSGSALVFLLGLIIWSGIPLAPLFRRLVWFAPFAGVLLLVYPFITPGETLFHLGYGSWGLAATLTGIQKAACILLRMFTAVLAGVLLTATTPFADLMCALRALRVPGVIVSLMEFTVRYIFVLTDEVQRMYTARKARGFAAGKSLLDFRAVQTLGLLIGVLFIRSYERGERVYQAMLSRGYTGEQQ